MSPATPLFYPNGMITHRWKREVGVSPVTPLFAYTLSNKKQKRRIKKKEKIKKKVNKDGLYQHHCSLELRSREERKRKERDQIRLHVCS